MLPSRCPAIYHLVNAHRQFPAISFLPRHIEDAPPMDRPEYSSLLTPFRLRALSRLFFHASILPLDKRKSTLNRAAVRRPCLLRVDTRSSCRILDPSSLANRPPRQCCATSLWVYMHSLSHVLVVELFSLGSLHMHNTSIIITAAAPCSLPSPGHFIEYKYTDQ